MKNPLKESCPNCDSAIDIGRDTEKCILCSDPRTGKSRGWVWRWPWLHNLLVGRKNFKKTIREFGG